MFGSGTGMADSRAFEYGCLQLAANLELSSSSIIWPKYIIAIRSLTFSTTDKLWDINKDVLAPIIPPEFWKSLILGTINLKSIKSISNV